MLRSELQPRTSFTAFNVVTLIVTATFGVLLTIGVVGAIASHAWQDDKRAERLHQLESDLPCVDGHVGTWVMTKLP